MRGVVMMAALTMLLYGCAEEETRDSEKVIVDSVKITREEPVDEGGEDVDTPDQDSVSGPDMTAPLDLPKDFKVEGEATGDLDGDGRPERVVVVTTDRAVEFGREREIRVYRWEQEEWKVMEIAVGPAYPSESGGMMGDPFAGVEVERGAIVLSHYGGSSLRWSSTTRFRRQNGRWELIGVTSGHGRPLAEWYELDYNLSTGRAIYTYTIYDEEGKPIDPPETIEFIEKRAKLPEMNGFDPGARAIDVPGGEEIYY